MNENFEKIILENISPHFYYKVNGFRDFPSRAFVIRDFDVQSIKLIESPFIICLLVANPSKKQFQAPCFLAQFFEILKFTLDLKIPEKMAGN
jgi:hypothetical protein